MSDQSCKATIAANFFGTLMMSNHRGVLPIDEGIVVFGNDGHKEDERSQRQVSMVRERLKTAFNLDEPGFGVSDDGYSWALVYSFLSADAERTAELESHKTLIIAVVSDCLAEAWQDANDLKKLDEQLNDE